MERPTSCVGKASLIDDVLEGDGYASERDSARVTEAIVHVHVAYEEGVHGGRHVGGIRVPMQNIEGAGALTEQVTVYVKRPDQVVGAQGSPGRPGSGGGTALSVIYPIP